MDIGFADLLVKENAETEFKYLDDKKELLLKASKSISMHIVFDPDIIFRVSRNDTFEVIVDDSSVVTFNFKQASFETQTKSKSRARK